MWTLQRRYRTTPVSLDDDARRLLESYNWPGNIRELKNIAEQVSVLAKGKLISTDELAKYLPGSQMNKLPVLKKNGTDVMSERELLYKMLFDMKSDLNELKKFVWNMAQNGNAGIAEGELPSLFKETSSPPSVIEQPPVNTIDEGLRINPNAQQEASQPIIIESDTHYEEESIEESLSIADMEKELIMRALDKHNGKRKDAALDLGISERTLYRKIKEYDVSA